MTLHKTPMEMQRILILAPMLVRKTLPEGRKMKGENKDSKIHFKRDRH